MKRFDKKCASYGVASDHENQKGRFERQRRLLRENKHSSFDTT